LKQGEWQVLGRDVLIKPLSEQQTIQALEEQKKDSLKLVRETELQEARNIGDLS
jgi:hypothetical protein